MTTIDATDDRRDDQAEPEVRSQMPRGKGIAGEDSEAAWSTLRIVGEDTEA